MIRPFLTLLILVLSLVSQAQDMKYSFLGIPDSLHKGANAIKRDEDYVIVINNTKSTIETRRYAFTILNEEGERWSYFGQVYDKFSSIKSLKGALYNKFGMLVKKASGKDFKDVSASSEISISEDNRARVHNFEYRDYPYTVEYEYEIENYHTFYLPSWQPQEAKNVSVQKSKFTLIAPQEYKPRLMITNFIGESDSKLDGKKQTWNWTATNLKAIRGQFAEPKFQDLIMSVRLGPSQFEMAGYTGNMDTWNDFGKFILSLNKGRDQVPEELKAKIREITSGAQSDREKVERLYSFLQKNTRYVSIQLGIGGFQPFEASYVYTKGYGDCKALSNYMYSMLKEVSIPSNYALVRAGSFERFMTEDFPSTQFNHAVLCVPLKGDTMWLECTNQYGVAGYMGEFTGNRKALLITDDGAKVVATPRYTHRENRRVRKLEGQLDAKGTLQLKSSTSFIGVESDNILSRLDHLTDQEISKWMSESMSLSSYIVNNFKHSVVKKGLPVVQQEVDLSATSYATVSGKRIFVCPNILSREKYEAEEETRTLDYEFLHSYTHEDSVKISIPEGYELETGIKPLTLESAAGTYTVAFKVEGSSITYYRKRVQLSGRIPATQQTALEAFFKAIMKNDASKIVFVKKEA